MTRLESDTPTPDRVITPPPAPDSGPSAGLRRPVRIGPRGARPAPLLRIAVLIVLLGLSWFLWNALQR